MSAIYGAPRGFEWQAIWLKSQTAGLSCECDYGSGSGSDPLGCPSTQTQKIKAVKEDSQTDIPPGTFSSTDLVIKL